MEEKTASAQVNVSAHIKIAAGRGEASYAAIWEMYIYCRLEKHATYGPIVQQSLRDAAEIVGWL